MGDDVFQANNLPSTRTPRGHQGPAGFLMLVSGLDKVTMAEFSYFEDKLGCFLFPFHAREITVPFLRNCIRSLLSDPLNVY
jgi:hypothetical protein